LITEKALKQKKDKPSKNYFGKNASSLPDWLASSSETAFSITSSSYWITRTSNGSFLGFTYLTLYVRDLVLAGTKSLKVSDLLILALFYYCFFFLLLSLYSKRSCSLNFFLVVASLKKGKVDEPGTFLSKLTALVK
jgi:hypothetical protein